MLQIPERAATAYDWRGLEVVFRRRRTRGPFKCPCVPGIVSRQFTLLQGAQQVDYKTKNACSLNQPSERSNQVESLPPAPRVVGIDSPWHAQQAREVHRVES